MFYGTTTRDGVTEYRSYIVTYSNDYYNNIERLEKADKELQKEINDLQQMIETLQAKRIELAERCNELARMPFKYRVHLKRYKRDFVTYELTIQRIYEDCTSETVSRKTFSGRERQQAIEEFKKAEKQFPGCDSLLDIAKGKWER